MKEIKRVKVRSGFKLNFIDLFGIGWMPYISSLLSSTYMFNLMVFLDYMYNIIPSQTAKRGAHNSMCYPLFQDLFENFRLCSFENTKVVIIGREPFANMNSTGVPFGNTSSTIGAVEGDTLLIERCIIQTYKDEYKTDDKKLDETLYSWAGQGVLLLDASSTSMKELKNAHSLYWKHFTRSIISTLSDKKDAGLIFVFWGTEASYFSKYVNKNKHHTLFYCHPNDMVRQNKDWNCPNFKQIDNIIKKKYGEKNFDKHRIYW